MSFGAETGHFERLPAPVVLGPEQRDLVTALGLTLGMTPAAIIALGVRVVAASLDDAELAAHVAAVRAPK